MPNAMPKRTYTIDEFADAYTVSRSTLYRLWRNGQGPAVMKVGKRKLIHVDAAEAWALEQIEGPGAHAAPATPSC